MRDTHSKKNIIAVNFNPQVDKVLFEDTHHVFEGLTSQPAEAMKERQATSRLSQAEQINFPMRMRAQSLVNNFSPQDYEVMCEL